jgi:hypothetical protein
MEKKRKILKINTHSLKGIGCPGKRKKATNKPTKNCTTKTCRYDLCCSFAYCPHDITQDNQLFYKY